MMSTCTFPLAAGGAEASETEEVAGWAPPVGVAASSEEARAAAAPAGSEAAAAGWLAAAEKASVLTSNSSTAPAWSAMYPALSLRPRLPW